MQENTVSSSEVVFPDLSQSVSHTVGEAEGYLADQFHDPIILLISLHHAPVRSVSNHAVLIHPFCLRSRNPHQLLHPTNWMDANLHIPEHVL